MNRNLLESLSSARRNDVLAAIAAVETAKLPVPAQEFRALMEPTLRHVVEEVLAAAGRVLIKNGPGYLTGYADDVREQLAALGIGVLPPEVRSVLTMVLLLSVAIPRAGGQLSAQDPWTSGVPVPVTLLKSGRIGRKGIIDDALRELRSRDLIQQKQGGVVPGPQFLRLTQRTCSVLFEELILLAEPHGDFALAIRRRRTPGRHGGVAHDD